MKNFLRYLRTRPLALTGVILLLVLYFCMIFAEFIAPYPATLTFQDNTFHPSNLQVTSKGLKVREYRVINKSTWRYARVKDAECIHSFRLFAKGASYKLCGVIPADRHLFGSDSEYPVYLLGADNLGRDLFSRIVYGSRISLTIGFVATAVSLVLAVILGGLSGYFGSVTDWAIMRFAEFFMLIPSLYFILFLRSLLNTRMDSGTAYMVITLILALVGWPGTARTIRGMVHAIKREEFVMDADLEGVPPLVVIFRHIIPQTSSLLIVSTALSVPGFIMSETTLSYLGLGISDPAVSWGSLINRDISTLSNLKNFPWLLYPVLMLLLVTLAFNFLGDALRDYFDPYSVVFKKSKGGRFPLVRNGARSSLNQNATLCHSDNAGAEGESLPLARTSLLATPSSGDTPASFRRKLDSFQRPDAPASFRRKLESSRQRTYNACSQSSIDRHCEEQSDEAISDSQRDHLLTVSDLRVNFTILRGTSKVTVQGVRGVSFYINKGEILGLVGESGSGKSVSTTAIPGLLPQNAEMSGHIYFEGTELTSLSENELRKYRGSKIALIFQEPGRSFDPLQNIGSVFFETFRITEPQITKEQSDEKAAALLKDVGLPDPKGRLVAYPHQFSGGQLQRIGIALALAQNCNLLIADEPTTALDVTIQAQIVSLLLKLKKERGLSIIFISHNINLVAQISDRIAVMYGGKIMEQGTSDQIMNHPKHPYTQALVAALPAFGSHYTKAPMISIPGRVTDPANPPAGCPFAPRCQYAKPECSVENEECYRMGE